tara:strand:- start:1761 stop:2588 length:828 start_codon:yes stop_codon:yes gene_type:complete
MAAPDIDDAFVTQFESEAHIEYQQMGSKLRNTIRTKNGVVGSSTTFQVIGNAEVGSKSREGDIPITHVSHAPVTCTMQDRYAGIYVDKLDELKIQHDERSAQTKNLASAMGKDTDSIITTQMDTSANSANVGSAATWTAAASPIAIMEAMGNASVPFDGHLYWVVPWGMWGDLLDIDEFSNSDYIGESNIWYEGVTAKDWLGYKWFPHENLPQDGSADTKSFAYHSSALGHGIAADFSIDMDYIPTKKSTLIAADMSHGACMIDDTGCVEVLYNT